MKDYDFVKQKSYFQDKQIKGLQAITQKQQAISQRKEFKLSSFSGEIISLQSKVSTLQSNLIDTKKQSFRRGFENWIWRGSTIIITSIIISKNFKF